VFPGTVALTDDFLNRVDHAGTLLDERSVLRSAYAGRLAHRRRLAPECPGP
jgi:hypothetical protein